MYVLGEKGVKSCLKNPCVSVQKLMHKKYEIAMLNYEAIFKNMK